MSNVPAGPGQRAFTKAVALRRLMLTVSAFSESTAADTTARPISRTTRSTDDGGGSAQYDASRSLVASSASGRSGGGTGEASAAELRRPRAVTVSPPDADARRIATPPEPAGAPHVTVLLSSRRSAANTHVMATAADASLARRSAAPPPPPPQTVVFDRAGGARADFSAHGGARFVAAHSAGASVASGVASGSASGVASGVVSGITSSGVVGVPMRLPAHRMLLTRSAQAMAGARRGSMFPSPSAGAAPAAATAPASASAATAAAAAAEVKMATPHFKAN